MIQLGWFGTPTSSSPFPLFELRIAHMVIQDGSWIKTISKSNQVSRIVLMMRLFFCTFCEKTLMFLAIMFVTVYNWMDWLGPRIMEFLIFFHVPFLVETMVPEWTWVGVCLVVIFAVEWIEIQFALFGFKTWRVYLEICLATPGKVVVIFDLVRAIAL